MYEKMTKGRELKIPLIVILKLEKATLKLSPRSGFIFLLKHSQNIVKMINRLIQNDPNEANRRALKVLGSEAGKQRTKVKMIAQKI
mmetsp:Transcript_294/g.177  ORF Transcript_294/g.177 Transcript_294/m.177 type:complete len:86 (-) Transcript_294:599-856(-)